MILLHAKVQVACQMSRIHVVMQSLLDGVDLEDLGMHCMDKTMQEHKDISLPKDTAFPAWLRDYCKVKASQCRKGSTVKQHAYLVVVTLLSQQHLPNFLRNTTLA